MRADDLHAATAMRGGEPPIDLDAEELAYARRPAAPGLGVVAIVSAVVASAIVVLALIGPWLAPHTISETIGLPFDGPRRSTPLGTDFLGRDLLSRVLAGGRGLVVFAFLATAAVTVVGATVGLVAGFSKGLLGAVLMRVADVLLILPGLLILLVLATGYGGGNEVLLASILLSASPFLARVTRAATLQVVGRGFVEAAIARGERSWWILAREIAPNISGVLLAYSGLLFVGAVYLTAAAAFLGISAPPPAANWGRMIQENMVGVELEPWGVAVPAALLVVLAVSVNLFADSLQRRFASGGRLRGPDE